MRGIPSGRAAVAAWQALDPQLRARIVADARAGHPAGDPELAVTAAGYGGTMGRRLGWMVPAGMVAMLPLMIAPAAASGSIDGLGPALILLALTLLALVGLIGFAVTGLVVRRRRWRMYAVNLPAAEAALIRAAEVPTDDHAPVGGPIGGPVGPDGGAVVRIRPFVLTRMVATVVTSVAVFVALLVALWQVDLTGARELRVVLTPIVVALIGAYLWIMVVSLVRHSVYRGDRTVLRVSPAGWEFPASRQRGTWAEVTEIGVYPYRRAARSQAAMVRLVVFQVPEPERHLAPVPWVLRRPAATALRRYGSPVGFMAVPRYTMPVTEAIELITRHTTTPVRWH